MFLALFQTKVVTEEPCAEEDSQTFLRHSDFYDVKIEMPS